MKVDKFPLVSICIPCFGRVKYVRNTLNSIYQDNADVGLDEYEVVISDNDPAGAVGVLVEEFKPYDNLHYFHTECEGFINSYYSLTYGKGGYLLLHNSQELFKKGSLRYIIDLVKNNRGKYLFFSSGFLLNGSCREYADFDSFMQNVSFWSSWSNAFGIWRSDFDIAKGSTSLNKLFPHTSLFLTQHFHKSYVICDAPLFETQFVKGRSGHNKFHAFTYEYPSLIDGAYIKGHITKATRNKILRDILYDYLPLLYFNVKIARRESWSATGFKEDIKVFFPKGSLLGVKILSIVAPIKAYVRKVRRQRL